MENKYDTKELAQKAIDENPDEYTKESMKFCPLSNNKCNQNCVCWCEPWVREHHTNVHSYPIKTDYYYINYGQCTSPMITGEIFDKINRLFNFLYDFLIIHFSSTFIEKR